MDNQPFNPLHGLTLKTIVTELEQYFGFDELGAMVNIRCFTHDPSLKSSLKFLRKTPWAREKVEALYLKNRHLISTADLTDNSTANSTANSADKNK